MNRVCIENSGQQGVVVWGWAGQVEYGGRVGGVSLAQGRIIARILRPIIRGLSHDMENMRHGIMGRLKMKQPSAAVLELGELGWGHRSEMKILTVEFEFRAAILRAECGMGFLVENGIEPQDVVQPFQILGVFPESSSEWVVEIDLNLDFFPGQNSGGDADSFRWPVCLERVAADHEEGGTFHRRG